MVTIELASFDDVRQARARVGEFARAAGLRDPEAAVMTTGELGNNCVEHGGESPGLLRVGRARDLNELTRAKLAGRGDQDVEVSLLHLGHDAGLGGVRGCRTSGVPADRPKHDQADDKENPAFPELPHNSNSFRGWGGIGAGTKPHLLRQPSSGNRCNQVVQSGWVQVAISSVVTAPGLFSDSASSSP